MKRLFVGGIKEDTKNISLEIMARSMEKLMSFEIITVRQFGKKKGIVFIIFFFTF